MAMPPHAQQLLGESRAIRELRTEVDRLTSAQRRWKRLPPILLLGETGTGKGLVARLLHARAQRRGGSFVDINCAAIPQHLLEAELFGFERGAFTDARQPKPGLFQSADQGTLFLDEIGLLAGELQGKLLAAVEDREVRRLGATRSEPVDAWIISASNDNLAVAVSEHRFRDDLYHRLAVLTLRLPALRERDEDALLLAQHFLTSTCAEYDLEPQVLSSDACAALMAYQWPGNIRELRNAVERAALLAEGRFVKAEHLRLQTLPAAPVDMTDPHKDPERDMLVRALESAGWISSHAAALLGISRNTLRHRIARYGLERRPSLALHRSRRRARTSPGATPPEPRIDRAGIQPAAFVRADRRLAFLHLRVDASPETPIEVELWSGAAEAFDEITAAGGRVEELGLDGLTAVFGVTDTDDVARRSALCAIAIRRRLRTPRCSVRAVLLVTSATILSSGSESRLAFESRRNVWERLTVLIDQAPPGSIVLPHDSAALIEDSFELVQLPSAGTEPALELKGPASRSAA